jgi:hypothetical protein
MDSRIQELLELAKEEGLTLPYPAAAIVDLRSGVILFGGVGPRGHPRRLTPTLLGMALSAVLAAEEHGQPRRDAMGRFVWGNGWARVGWAALVVNCFGGDVAAAKVWLGRLGVWAYGQQCLNPYWPVKPCFLAHPGTPRQFMASWQAALEFTLADVPELAF